MADDDIIWNSPRPDGTTDDTTWVEDALSWTGDLLFGGDEGESGILGGFLGSLLGGSGGSGGSGGIMSLLPLGIAAAQSAGLFGDSSQRPVGYQGGIPDYTAVRSRVPYTYDPKRRPGSSGQQYFTDTQFVPPEQATAAKEQANIAARSAAIANRANPARRERPVAMNTGGIASIAKSKPMGRYLGGPADGMADTIPASINGSEPAALSDGEYVIAADVVSHLGNGNSEAGAKVLDDMMMRIRKARTGNPKQGKQINPKRYTPA